MTHASSRSGSPHINAVPGPSTLPTIFLAPPGPPPNTIYLKSTQDLLATFRLIPAYEKYVRNELGTTTEDAVVVPADKGKGKERESAAGSTPAADLDPDHDQDNDDDDGQPNGAAGEKKKRNNYRHLIKGLPGKHSLKKDDYLTTIMQAPPKQRIPIIPFDARTQRDAFTVSLEGLKGWNTSTLILESAQAREDRKKRKELKRLAKAQAQNQHNAALAAATAVPLPTVSSLVSRPGSARPVGTPRPMNRPTVPPVHVQSASRVSTPISNGQKTSTPTGATNPYSLQQQQLVRGKKREREESVGTPVAQNQSTQMQLQPQTQTLQPPPPIVSAKAGSGGVRPRPIKKQRMDLQGQSRDAGIQQQPTPQGV